MISKEDVLQIIRDVYSKDYIGDLVINQILPYGYSVRLGIPDWEKGITISAQLDEKDFLSYLKKELKSKKLHYGNYYTFERVFNE